MALSCEECQVNHSLAKLASAAGHADAPLVHKGLRTGHLLSLGGAGAVLGSLCIAWYAIHLQGRLQSVLTEQSTRLPPALRELAKGLVQVLPENISGTGGQALHGADILLAGGAALVILAIVMAAGAGGAGVRVAPAVAGRVALVAGLVLAGIVLVKIMNPIGPNDLVTVQDGAWLALGGSALMATGGLLASHSPAPPEAERPATASPPAAQSAWGGHSVAPPPHLP